MPWVGDTPTRTDGTRTGPTVWDQAAVAVETILSDDHDTHDQDLANMIGICLNREGANAVAADISWGNFKITNLADGVNPGDVVNKGQMDAADAALQTNIDGKLANVVEDTTPQLGGDLDVNGFSIISVSNGNIPIAADGTGSVTLSSATGDVKLQGITYPSADGIAGDLMTTDGVGNLTLQTPAPLIFSSEFISAGQTITAAGSFNIPHGMAVKPKIVQVALLCIVNEGNWVAGEEIENSDVQSLGTVSLAQGIALTTDSSNIFARYGAGSGGNVFESLDKTTGARFTLTSANWQVVVRAFA